VSQFNVGNKNGSHTSVVRGSANLDDPISTKKSKKPKTPSLHVFGVWISVELDGIQR
jgi:hypothetical protein